MDIFNVLSMVGGLAIFLYGMKAMGDGLAKMAGGKMERILEKLTTKKIFAVLLGAGVTAVIQSSSATTVMVVGFVNSGIMKLGQAVGIIMGANVGTTITSWMLSLTGIQGDSVFMQLLKPSSFSPILAAIGIILIMASKEESKKKDVGGILLGFAILMMGMTTMSDAVAGLADNPSFTSLMTAFSNPLLGMAAGAILTAIIQSSSASVGIIQALSATGAVTYSVAIPVIMGQNIGTCVTSLLSSVGASKNARRAAMIHLFFNLIGTVIFMVMFYAINAFIDFAFLENAVHPGSIAIVHTLFNIGATVVLFPFANKLVKLAELVIPDDKTEETNDEKEPAISIDERFMARPAFAMEVCRSKAREMAEISNRTIELALDVLVSYDRKKADEVKKLESVIDKYEDALGSYLVKLSSKNLSAADSQSMSRILHSLSDFERITDYAKDVVEAVEELSHKDRSFTPNAKKEIETVANAIRDVCKLTINGYCEHDSEAATHVEPLEQVIDVLIKTTKENHVRRLKKGECTIEMGFALEDILTGLERVSDHCSNLAVEMLTIDDNDYNTHGYFKNFTEDERAAFNAEYDELIKKYPIHKEGSDI